MNRIVGILGISAVSIFIVVLLIFASINPEFNILNDYVSRLGAKGAPNAIWFNLFGFLLVGIILIGFGLTYGNFIKDKLVGILLAFFGLGFAFTSIPFEIGFSNSSISKAHTAAITLGLASWLFGLARISYNKSLDRSTRFRANIAAILLVSSMTGFVIGFWSMPITHRLVFGVVFVWTVFTAASLTLKRNQTKV
jgi:hypothetical membrane protein